MIPRYVVAALASVFLVSSTGCDTSSTNSDDEFLEIRPGEIFDLGVGARVVINGTTVSDPDREPDPGPATVRAGIPFDVTTHTYGAPVCYRPAASVSTVDGRTARVAVRDSIFGGPCAFVLTYLPRTDRIAFTTPGSAEIIIEGTSNDGRVSPTPATLRFPVVVTQ